MILILWSNEICHSHPSIANGFHFVNSMEFAYVIKLTVQTIEEVRNLYWCQQAGHQVRVAYNVRKENGAHLFFFGFNLLPVPKGSGDVSREHIEQKLIGSRNMRIFQSSHLIDWICRPAIFVIQIIKSIVTGCVCA